jgi:hypothetical protein
MNIYSKGGILWCNKSADLERIGGQVWTAGNLAIRITKVLNTDADKTGGLGRTEGNLLNEAMDSALGSLAP